MNKLKNQKMSGGIVEIIRLKRQLDEKQRNIDILARLENDDEDALITEAF